MEPSRDFDTVKRIVAELGDEGLPTEEFPELVAARMYSRYRVPPSERREANWRSDVLLILREPVGAGFETEVV